MLMHVTTPHLPPSRIQPWVAPDPLQAYVVQQFDARLSGTRKHADWRIKSGSRSG